ncbi:MurR/RpiR family transcriptional regulator [Candidatus Stoquefichus sp. SB1]|jgi:DNA-binding MurR/RpiR family transcriptional regulator|uniref:MurR/RpiR family transcriptional regulator n=1 Tax=Candidatus Stoquefichus sp. SB1 TaxID=1658109 RepID=UPI00067E681E|nr:MurR/RpiR family transcriptional regulator [Candidatus Stoquefichus sp. SB1]
MLIIEKLNLKEKMSEGEESIADFVLTLGKELHKYSTRNIAEATYTSAPTVIRLCKKLGFKGFEDFKEQFLKEIEYLDQQYGKVDVNFPFDAKDTMMRAAHKISHLYEETIHDSMSLLHHDDLQKALNLMKYSHSIHVFSYGTALNLAESFKEKMLKIGKNVIISNNLNYQLYEVTCIPKGDLAIIISYSGETVNIIKLAEICQKRGIPIIAVTSFGENTLSQLSSVQLTMSTKESLYHNIGDFSTHLSTHFILDILYAVYFLSNYDENYHNRIQKSGDLESLRSSTNPIISSGEE